MFVLPWGEVSVVGTTDTDWSGDPASVAADREDVTYLLRSANAMFPNARLATADVIAAWAGLRPLLADAAGSTGSVPREHRILESPSGLLTIAGGKLTTYRSMAAELVDRVAERLARLDGRPRAARPRTDREPLPGGEVADAAALADQLAREGVAPAAASHLVSVYGAEAAGVANLAAADRDLAQPLVDGFPHLRAEVVYHARREMAMTVSDVFLRRTHLFYDHPQQALSAAGDVARLLGGELGWSESVQADAVDAYRSEVDRMRAVLRGFAAP
jgi:glycerol-3-phosphate dehydrogenase